MTHRHATFTVVIFLLIASCCALSAYAPAIAQPATVEWLTMETPHFSITFQKGQEAAAQEAAYYAEQADAKIIQQLGSSPKEKTQLVLIDSIDNTNGLSIGGVGYPEEVYFLTYGRPHSEIRSRIDTWIYTLAVHEHLHTIHLNMNAGWPSVVRSLFGDIERPRATPIPQLLWPNLTAPNNDLPVYLVEGFAAYMETINSDGGRLRDSPWEMFMRADFVNNQIMTRGQASGKYPFARFTGGATYYMYGAYFCDYIARNYGQDKLFQIMRESSNSTPLFIDNIFNSVLGKSLPAVWDDFITAAKATYARQADTIKAQGLTNFKRITYTGEYATSPVFSPDGSQIAYAQGGRHLVPAVREVRPDATLNRTVVTADTVFSDQSFSWSPDGTKLIYGDSDYVGAKVLSDLYLFDLKTKQRRQLTHGLRAYAPTWSPDDQMIVFVANTDTLQTSLMAMDSDGSHIRELFKGQDEMQFSSPRFSPDGKQISVSILSFGGYEDIYLLNADGSGLRPVTQDRAKDDAPQWSPDGQYILFDSDRSGVSNIYAFRPSDNLLLQVTNVLNGAFSPTMSPDGKKIAFVTYESPAGFDLAAIDADPSSWKPVANRWDQLPKPPDFAQATKDYTIHPYSELGTLLPRMWQPVLTLSTLGALTDVTDAFQDTSYTAVAGYDFQGGSPYDFSLHIEHKFSDVPPIYPGRGPQPPMVSLDLAPDPTTGISVTGNAELPLQQSMRFDQLVNLTATVGTVATIQTDQGSEGIRGLELKASWTMSFQGGEDSVATGYSLGVSGIATVTSGSIQTGVSANASASWAIQGDYVLRCEVTAEQTATGTGKCSLQFPLIHLEAELGTWPIYFDKILIQGALYERYTTEGLVTSYGAFLIFHTFLWYNYAMDTTVGVLIGADGQVQPYFNVGF
jgi:Tol biopolymer transport system component